jgi:hypothetical protein
MQAAIHGCDDEVKFNEDSTDSDTSDEDESDHDTFDGGSAFERFTRSNADLAVARDKMRVLLSPLLADPTTMQSMKSPYGLLPLHIAVLFQAAATIFTEHDVWSFSCLDLHEICQERCTSKVEWQRVRELLVAFAPTLESHRHREELLAQCVDVVRKEVTLQGSYHLQACQHMENAPDMPDLEITHTLSALEMQFHEEQKGSNVSGGLKSLKNDKKSTQGRRQRRHREESLGPQPSMSHESAASGWSGQDSRQSIENQRTMFDDADMGLEYVLSEIVCKNLIPSPLDPPFPRFLRALMLIVMR